MVVEVSQSAILGDYHLQVLQSGRIIMGMILQQGSARVLLIGLIMILDIVPRTADGFHYISK